MNNYLFLSFLLFIAMACEVIEKDPDGETVVLEYPETAKVDSLNVYFGDTIADPYRWLENDTSNLTEQWVKAQNQLTFSYLERIDYRDTLRERLEYLLNYERVYAPVKHGDYYYFFKNDGLQNQNVWYRKKSLDGEAEVFLDPNEFSEEGTISLGGTSFTKDGSLVAFTISEGGSDWRKAIVLNAETKEQIGDTLRNLKFTGISWKGNDGFYYSSYDKPKQGSALSGKTQYHKLYYHKLNSPQEEDELIFGGEEQPRRYIRAYLTEDERFLVITAAQSTSGNELYIKDLSKANSRLVSIINNDDDEHYVLANEGNRLLIHTSLNAPNNRIVETTIGNPGPDTWKDTIAEQNEVMNASTAGGKIYTNYLIDAKTDVKQYDMQGKLEKAIELPDIGTAYGFSGRLEDTVLYYTFTSFTYPSTVFEYNIKTGESREYERPDIDFDPEQYETKQVFYTSKDGTRVPMFIVHKKGIELNGKNPTYLYAYGGFNISLTPSFSTSRLVWLENNGIYAQPNLRGGGEYGEKWHKAGTKMQKQNVFDDFIAAGEYLIENKYTGSDYLAIAGGSNGGLLVGATITQRPDLAKVALPAVGVLDMLRYHTFTAGAGWASDYGTAEESREMYEYLRAYSPLHNIKDSVEYPATMITTADHDDRVVPAHSFKFAATLQEKHKGNNPILIRIETDAGHGAGTPISKQIEQYADIYAFTWYNMNVTPEIAKHKQ
jgi:prolyl oligopeptidase